ncbi:hypothetical protein JX265_007183 [Neoarthrinium moseri]|uniref:Protein ECM13 n=1 Tax=Neoarthrinium moseri TaxID=1658444 RepID=A0A9P9WL44_9PEZI|nr:uncharacterized protein JN550_010081 [Neoarthrinium moseri]KAI1840701.1 hypothetical protein JX266_013108 [Neoarthrinium moseri]KAI1862744.1 hypothetical protein JN550_010081 [Neoarthrinium moseri]KAI1868360.1 hypothetical protein JX265_007183 [Neoarthrinium moseri]
MVSTTAFSSPFHHPHSPPPTPKKMSITQTYYLAHKARAKLSREAAQPDHNLRLLVGHANLLDSLMLDLADAEREQESWFNQSVRGASPKTEDRHVQWADSTPEQAEDDWDSSDSDSDISDDDDIEMADVVPLRRVPSNTVVPPSPQLQAMDEDDFEEEDEEEDFAALTLTRSPSHSASPPELDDDFDSSEDESMPPSPPFAVLPTFSDKRRETTVTTSEYYDDSRQEAEDHKADFYDQGFYLPPRNPARLVSAISVY